MKMTKLEAAKHQLAVAIQLFLDEDYLSSLTLAGAAEEILGKLSMRAGKPVAIDDGGTFLQKLLDHIPLSQPSSNILYLA